MTLVGEDGFGVIIRVFTIFYLGGSVLTALTRGETLDVDNGENDR